MTRTKWALLASMLLIAPQVAAQAPQPSAIAFDPALFDKYVGFYRLTPRMVIEVSRDGPHFYASAGPRKIEILPESPSVFFVQGAPVTFTFATDAQGMATGVTMHQGGNDVAAPRIDAAAAQAIRALPPPPVGHPMPRNWPVMQGVTPRDLTSQSGGSLDYWPCFSPDGHTVLFSRTMDGGKSWTLLRVPAMGGAPAPFLQTPLAASVTRADWSANDRVAFTVTGADGSNSIWVAKGDGTDAHAVPGSKGMIYPSWYPDGKRLAADSADFSIKRLDLAGGEPSTLTDHAQVLTGMGSVSPDGNTIAFAGQKSAGQPYNQEENVIWVTDGGSAATTLETPPVQGRAPVWSPDGKRLAFESDRGSPDGHYAIFVINRDGSGLMQVTDYALNANHPVWSRDGRHMVFAKADPVKNTSTIAMVDFPASRP